MTKSFDNSRKSSNFAPSIISIVFWLAFCRQPYFSVIDFFWSRGSVPGFFRAMSSKSRFATAAVHYDFL